MPDLLAHAERDSVQLPRQLVHGDFWDNNVLFHKDRVVLVADLDFMGERLRIDDLALVLYYTNSTFWDDPLSDDRMRKLRGLVDAYDSGLTDHLTSAERAALPLALARTPLCFVGMVASDDTKAPVSRGCRTPLAPPELLRERGAHASLPRALSRRAAGSLGFRFS